MYHWYPDLKVIIILEDIILHFKNSNFVTAIKQFH